MSTLDSLRQTVWTVGLAAGLTLLSGGCRLMVDPFRDELACQPAVSTPSVEGARHAQAGTPSDLRGDYERFALAPEAGAVTHGPLYFEDSFEDSGSDDGRFAWAAEDYLQLFYWRGRLLFNGVFFPASVVASPPWTVMESDGNVGRRCPGLPYDARRLAAEELP